jgi:hypothetical protein
MQRAVNKAVEEAVLSMWFAYIQSGATDVFSMDPPRGCISSTVVQKEIEGRQYNTIILKLLSENP